LFTCYLLLLLLPLLLLVADDPLLVDWVKEAAPFIGVPPPNMNLTGWRDPFVVERPCDANEHEWVVLMGSGGPRQWASDLSFTHMEHAPYLEVQYMQY
jgi:hypothetical protein